MSSKSSEIAIMWSNPQDWYRYYLRLMQLIYATYAICIGLFLSLALVAISMNFVTRILFDIAILPVSWFRVNLTGGGVAEITRFVNHSTSMTINTVMPASFSHSLFSEIMSFMNVGLILICYFVIWRVFSETIHRIESSSSSGFYWYLLCGLIGFFTMPYMTLGLVVIGMSNGFAKKTKGIQPQLYTRLQSFVSHLVLHQK